MYDLSVENDKFLWFVTIRTINERLWFLKNEKLEYYILAFLAKYILVFNVELYAFCLMGNHYHMLVRFPKNNRAAFLKAFNAIVAKLVISHVPNYPGGKLWARRARVQAVPASKCCIDTFLYTALNPTSSGLVQNPRDYPGYNSFFDSINAKVRSFNIFNRSAFYKRSQYDKNAKKKDFIETYRLEYKKLPPFIDFSQDEYKKLILEQYHNKHKEILQDRIVKQKQFPKLKSILSTQVGAKPFNSKKSDRYSKRPLILTKCLETKNMYNDWYFGIVNAFKVASERLRSGIIDALFPPGTYRPSVFCPC